MNEPKNPKGNKKINTILSINVIQLNTNEQVVSNLVSPEGFKTQLNNTEKTGKKNSPDNDKAPKLRHIILKKDNIS